MIIMVWVLNMVLVVGLKILPIQWVEKNILVLVNNHLINGTAGIQAALFYDIALGIVYNEKLIQKIRQVYKQHVLKDVEDFHLYDYQKFEEEIWSLKEEFNLQKSFLS